MSSLHSDRALVEAGRESEIEATPVAPMVTRDRYVEALREGAEYADQLARARNSLRRVTEALGFTGPMSVDGIVQSIAGLRRFLLGMSAALGYPDGEAGVPDEMIEQVEREGSQAFRRGVLINEICDAIGQPELTLDHPMLVRQVGADRRLLNDVRHLLGLAKDSEWDAVFVAIQDRQPTEPEVAELPDGWEWYESPGGWVADSRGTSVGIQGGDMHIYDGTHIPVSVAKAAIARHAGAPWVSRTGTREPAPLIQTPAGYLAVEAKLDLDKVEHDYDRYVMVNAEALCGAAKPAEVVRFPTPNLSKATIDAVHIGDGKRVLYEWHKPADLPQAPDRIGGWNTAGWTVSEVDGLLATLTRPDGKVALRCWMPDRATVYFDRRTEEEREAESEALEAANRRRKEARYPLWAIEVTTPGRDPEVSYIPGLETLAEAEHDAAALLRDGNGVRLRRCRRLEVSERTDIPHLIEHILGLVLDEHDVEPNNGAVITNPYDPESPRVRLVGETKRVAELAVWLDRHLETDAWICEGDEP